MTVSNAERVTPGPWDYWLQPIEKIYRICHSIDGGGNRVIVGFVSKKADAALVAAAPELLAALKGIVVHAPDHVFVKARAAIAKAEGGNV